MFQRVQRTLTICAAIGLSACATTTFTSSWRAPDAQPVGSLKGQKVVAIVATKDVAARRAGEDALAKAVTAQGAIGVPGYTIVPDDMVRDETRARAAIEASGAIGVVVMRPVAKDKEISSTTSMYGPAMYGGPMYGPYWGGYYGYGWGGAWGGTTDIRTDTIVTVETLVYSLKQNKLLWAGQSKTTNPSKIDEFVRELATGAASEMKKAGLL
ncbi:MAG TPA: hypothetical protein VGG73_08940 [Vicinamibacterales bacterium]|jgi:hypothetical protein